MRRGASFRSPCSEMIGLNLPPQTIDDLPKVIPIFPLGGAVLFPRGQLPLNIFEPRYLMMIDDARLDSSHYQAHVSFFLG